MSVLTELHWQWMRVAGSWVAHLVPPRPGRDARSACGSVAVYGRSLERPDGLLGAAVRCRRCEEHDR